jgi:hypothetical protein
MTELVFDGNIFELAKGVALSTRRWVRYLTSGWPTLETHIENIRQHREIESDQVLKVMSALPKTHRLYRETSPVSVQLGCWFLESSTVHTCISLLWYTRGLEVLPPLARKVPHFSEHRVLIADLILHENEGPCRILTRDRVFRSSSPNGWCTPLHLAIFTTAPNIDNMHYVAVSERTYNVAPIVCWYVRWKESEILALTLRYTWPLNSICWI